RVQNNAHIDALRYVRSPDRFISRSPDDRLLQTYTDRRADRMSLAAGTLDEHGNTRPMTWTEERAWIASVVALPVHGRGSLLVSWIKTYAKPTVVQLLRWYRLLNDKLASGKFTRELERLEREYRPYMRAWAGATFIEHDTERPCDPPPDDKELFAEM